MKDLVFTAKAVLLRNYVKSRSWGQETKNTLLSKKAGLLCFLRLSSLPNYRQKWCRHQVLTKRILCSGSISVPCNHHEGTVLQDCDAKVMK